MNHESFSDDAKTTTKVNMKAENVGIGPGLCASCTHVDYAAEYDADGNFLYSCRYIGTPPVTVGA